MLSSQRKSRLKIIATIDKRRRYFIIKEICERHNRERKSHQLEFHLSERLPNGR